MTCRYRDPAQRFLSNQTRTSCGSRLGKASQRFFLGACLGLAFCFAPAAEAAPPTLTHLFPAGGQRGSKVVVTSAGTYNWPGVKIWAPGVEAVPTAESGKIEITIPADLMADRVWIRYYDAEGASAVAPFLIGSHPELTETEPNNRLGDATKVEQLPMTVNAALKDGADVDSYAVQLTAGQTLVAAVDANTRLGSPMDSILQVASPDGIVLAENHDDLKLDPRLTFTARKDGTYIVRMFAFPSQPDSSIRFTGGAHLIYRLTLTTGPLVTHAVPLSVPLSDPGQPSIAGWNLPAQSLLNVVPFGGARLGDYQEYELSDDLRRSPDARIGFASLPDFSLATRVRLTPYPAVTDQPSLEDREPFPVTVPVSLTGCLKRPKVPNRYRLPLQKGQQILISVEARSLDLTLDPVLTLTDPTGAVVADVDDSGPTKDSIIGHTAAHDGDYIVTVGDRFRKGGDRAWYLLTIRNEQADFEVSLASDSIVLEPEKPTEVTVKIIRRASAAEAVGPVTIQAAGLPTSVTGSAVISEPSGPSAGEVKLTLTSNGEAFSGPIRIMGATTMPREIERSARVPGRLGVQLDSVWLTATKKPE
ncbi:PPC domain-containing protein [Schlesneria sp. DSM 10557]|uniref:PPC domain-containing protein n=1 Tax=Schlesneria sp. DSM 10557 TaxID=3044399 RepID=UPI0035A0609B